VLSHGRLFCFGVLEKAKTNPTAHLLLSGMGIGCCLTAISFCFGGLKRPNVYDLMGSVVANTGMGVGLKNSQHHIPDVQDVIEFAINEECQTYDECDLYSKLSIDNKPVFGVEYKCVIPIMSYVGFLNTENCTNRPKFCTRLWSQIEF
jgi:hypothetical protein